MVPFALAGVVWSFATPLFTGPDEVSQARRAAAVVRGELTGRHDRVGPPVLLTVEVPPLYGTPAEENWLCHLGPLVPGAPQEPMALPSPPCPDLHAGLDDAATDLGEPGESGAGEGPDQDALVDVETVQYRGQPFFYALVGLPTLVDDGIAGAYGMRVAGALLTAALLASAAATAASAHRRALAGLGLLACVTPGVVYLGGTTNPSAVEIAAALSAWAAVAMLATTRPDQVHEPLTGRLVRRLGTALVVLALCRGLGPAFAVAVVALGASAAGRRGLGALEVRRDVRWWGAALVAAIATSGTWLAHIGAQHPLPERPGSGFTRALGWLPWYLRQSVGVFGTNDSAVSPFATVVWCAVAMGVFAAGLALLLRGRGSGSGAGGGAVAADGADPGVGVRRAVVAVLALVGGLAMNVTAEGLSLPPIGFFWQGRYALPLALGGIILATTSRPSSRHHAHPPPHPDPLPSDEARSNDRFPTSGSPADGRRPPGVAWAVGAVGAVVLVAVHGHALWTVTDHLSVDDGARSVALGAYVVALGALARVAIGPLRHREPRPGRQVGS